MPRHIVIEEARIEQAKAQAEMAKHHMNEPQLMSAGDNRAKRNKTWQD